MESPFDKPVILPAAGNHDPATHAWADARFAIDTLAEHALFFVMLMPPEVAAEERAEAVRFHENLTALYQQIDAAGPLERSALKPFVNNVLEQMKPFVEYKARMGEAQTSGKLRSLVWVSFFDHTRHEAKCWMQRLTALAQTDSELDRTEVTKFWTNILDEHVRFVAHLLDPDEYELIETAMKTSRVFTDLHNHGGIAGAATALVHEPGTVIDSLVENPETDAILSAAETILDFKTKAARGIEAAHIKSIIDPRLADHVRCEALKAVDDLKRAA